MKFSHPLKLLIGLVCCQRHLSTWIGDERARGVRQATWVGGGTMDRRERESAEDLAVSKREAAGEAVTILAVGIVGAAFMIWGLWSIGASVLGWLKSGIWSHPSLLEVGQRWGWDAPSYDWVIIQRVIMWFIGLPSGLIFVVLAVWLFSAAQQMDEGVSARERRMRLKAKT